MLLRETAVAQVGLEGLARPIRGEPEAPTAAGPSLA